MTDPTDPVDPAERDPDYDWRSEVDWPHVRRLILLHGLYWALGAAQVALYRAALPQPLPHPCPMAHPALLTITVPERGVSFAPPYRAARSSSAIASISVTSRTSSLQPYHSA